MPITSWLTNLRRFWSERTAPVQSRYERERLGAAISSFPIVGAARVGRRLYLVSRNLTPTRVVVFDLDTGAVTAEVRVPTGLGAWGVATDGTEWLYLGQFGARGQANLYRIDLSTHRLQTLAAIDADYLWDLGVAPDGMVYGVTESFGFRYDPRERRASLLGVAASGRKFRSIAVTEQTIYLGGARHGRAELLAFDRDSQRQRSVLPEALARHTLVYTLEAAHGRLVIGTHGPGTRDPALAVLDLPDARNPRIATLDGEAIVDGVAVSGDAVYATVRRSGAVVRFDPNSAAVEQLAVPLPFVEHRGLFPSAGRLLGVAGNGSLWWLELASREVERVDLVGSGLLEGSPERPQSLLIRDGTLWAGGNFAFQERVLASGATRRRFAAGEPKDLAMVDGELYLPLYPSAQLWRLPPGADEAFAAAVLPPEQNRPVSIHHDAERDWLLVSTAADDVGGGALHVYERASGALRTHRNPIAADQIVAGVISRGDTAYLGGGPRSPDLVAWDLPGGRVRWRLDDVAPDGFLVGFAIVGDRLYGFTHLGWFVVVDTATRRVEHRERVADEGGRLVVAGDWVYGVNRDSLYRFEPESLRHEAVVSGLDSQLWGFAFLATDEDGAVYVMQSTDVLRVRLRA